MYYFDNNYPRRFCRSAWVGRPRPCACLSVCLFVCPQHNSKKINDPKVFKFCIGNGRPIPISDMVLGLKGQRSRSQGQ